MIATEEEMISANIKPEHRNYCAHHLLDFYKCRRKEYPLVYKCKHELHMWEECNYDE